MRFLPQLLGNGWGWGVGWKWAPIGGLQYQTHMQAPTYDVHFLRSEVLRSSSSSSSRTRQIKECKIIQAFVSRTSELNLRRRQSQNAIIQGWWRRVITGATRHAKLQSNHHQRHTDIQLFTDRMPFLSTDSVSPEININSSYCTGMKKPNIDALPCSKAMCYCYVIRSHSVDMLTLRSPNSQFYKTPHRLHWSFTNASASTVHFDRIGSV